MNLDWRLDGIDPSLFENIPSMVLFLSPKGRILYSNEHSFNELGMEPELLEYHNFIEFLDENHPIKMEDIFQEVIQNQEPVSKNIWLKDNFGQSIQFNAYFSYSRNENHTSLIIAILQKVMDISFEESFQDQKAQLMEERKLIRNVIEKNPYGVAIFNQEGNYLHGNAALRDVWGETRDLDINLFQTPDLLKSMSKQEFYDKISDKSISYEYYFNPSDFGINFHNKPMWIHARFFSIKSNQNEIDFIIAMYRDITKEIEMKITIDEYQKHLEELVEERTQELQIERSQLLSIFNSIDEIIYVVDPETDEILFVNQYFKEILKTDPTGGLCTEEFYSNPSKCPHCNMELIQDLSTDPCVWEYYNKVQEKYYRIIDRLIYWPDNRKVRLELALDITEQKQAEQEIRKRLEFEQIISEITSRFIGKFDVFEVLRKSIRDLGKLSQVDRVYLLQVAEDGNIISYYEWDSSNTPRLEKNFESVKIPMNSWWIKTLKSQKSIIIDHITSENSQSIFFDGYKQISPFKSLMIYPIIVRDIMTGFMAFEQISNYRNWTDLDQNLMKMSTQVFCNSFEKIWAETDLARDQATLDRIIQMNPFGIVIFDKDGYYLRSNAAFRKIAPVGLTENYCFFNDPYFKSLGFDSKFDQLRNKKVVQLPAFKFNPYDIGLNNEFSKIYYVRLTVFPTLTPKGQISNYVAMMEDITKQKEIELQKKESEEKYRGLFENSAIGIGIISLSGEIRQVNETLQKIMGYSEEELCRLKIRDILAEPFTLEDIRTELKQNQILDNYEIKLSKKSGESFWALISSRLIEYEGKVAHIATMININNRKLAEKMLKAQEKQFRSIFENAPLSMAIINDQGFVVQLNPKFIETFGYTLKDIPTNQDWWNKAYPNKNYKTEVIDKWYKDLQTIKNRNVVSRFFKVQTKWGDIREISFKMVELDQSSLLILLEDLTEFNKTQRALKESEKHYRTLVETSNDIVFKLDIQGRFQFVNQAFTRILGYTLEEVRGHASTEYVVPEDRWIIKERNEKVLAGQPASRVQYKALSKSGEIVYLSTNAQPILDEHHEVEAIYGSGRDITEEIRAQREVERSEQKYRRVVETSSDIIFVSDLEGNYLFLNSANARILGYELEELMLINGFSLIHPKDIDDVQEQIHDLLNGERIYNIEYRFRKKSGDYIHLSTNGTPIKDSDGNVIAMLGVARDVTELKKKEQEIRDKEIKIQYSSVMSMISSMLVHDVGKVHENINNILKTLGNSVGGDLILLLHHEKQETEIEIEIEGKWQTRDFSYSSEKIIDLLETDYFRSNVIKLPRNIYQILTPEKIPEDIQELFLNISFNEVLLLPVFIGEERYGTILYNSVEPNLFTQQKIVLCLNVGLLLGLGLKNASNQEIIDHLFDALSHLEVGIYILQKLDKNYKFVFVNSYVCKFLGMSKKELLNLESYGTILPSKEFEKIEKMAEARKKGLEVPQNYKTKLKTKDGLKEVLIRMTPGILEGKPALFGLASNISRENMLSTSEILDMLQKKYQFE